MGFPRQEYWSGLPFPPPGDLPDSGTEPAALASSALAGRFFTTGTTWIALKTTYRWRIKGCFALVTGDRLKLGMGLGVLVSLSDTE